MNRIISEELKPCPWCNGPVQERNDSHTVYHYGESNCPIGGVFDKRMWNSRPLATALDLSGVQKWYKYKVARAATGSEEFVCVSDLQTLQPPSGQVGEVTDGDILKHLKSVGYTSEVGLNDILKLARALRQPIETVGEDCQEAFERNAINWYCTFEKSESGEYKDHRTFYIFGGWKEAWRYIALRTQPQAPELSFAEREKIAHEYMAMCGKQPQAPVVEVSVDEWIKFLEKNTSPRLWGADRRRLAEQIVALLQSKGGR